MAAGTDLKREFFQRGYLAQPSVFFTRALYEQVGGLNQSLKFCMDYELWCRFALAGARFTGIDADISGNRWYETTKTSAQLLELLSEVAATQRRLFGAVSPYYVQGISDYLYSVLHARFWRSAPLRLAVAVFQMRLAAAQHQTAGLLHCRPVRAMQKPARSRPISSAGPTYGRPGARGWPGLSARPDDPRSCANKLAIDERTR
jgi:hypothetical protein